MNDSETISQKLDELIFWTKFSALPMFRTILVENLRTDTDKLVYELSNGKRSTRQISKLITKGGRKITHVTIANMWQRWNILNLVIPAERMGRYRKVISLEALGIDIRDLEKTTEELK